MSKGHNQSIELNIQCVPKPQDGSGTEGRPEIACRRFYRIGKRQPALHFGGGFGTGARADFYSAAPNGRKYCVPLTGSCKRRRSCWRSALRSTKSISEVLITSRSDAE